MTRPTAEERFALYLEEVFGADEIAEDVRAGGIRQFFDDQASDLVNELARYPNLDLLSEGA